MLRFFLVCLMGVALSTQADSPSAPGEDLFQKGLAAYQAGRYEEARENFEKVGGENPNLLHNLGLTYNQLGQKAKALALWRKALAVDPTFTPARAARDFMEARNSMPSFERDGAQLWMRRTLESLSLFMALSLLALALSAAGVLWIRYVAARRLALDLESPLPPAPSAAIAFSVLMVLLLAVAGFKMGELFKTRATIVAAQASARSLPSEESVALFDVRGGSEVLVRREQEGWKQIQNFDGSSGWLKDSDLFVTSGR